METQVFQDDNKKKKQKTPEEIRAEVQKKLIMKRLQDMEGYKNKPMPKIQQPLPQNNMQKSESPKGKQEINRQKKVEPNVFKSIDENAKIKSNETNKKSLGGFGVFTGNATDMRNPNEFKVKKQYQNRVNKVLGNNY